MALFETISKDIMEAMKAKDAVRRDTLRNVKKEFLEAKTAGTAEPTDADYLKLIAKMVKKGRDAAEIFVAQGRQDLADGELAQVRILEEYLPKALTPEELRQRVAALIAETGASGPQDMGKVMGAATKALAGQADGKALSAVVRELLAAL